MSFQALRKFRIPPPHPQLLSHPVPLSAESRQRSKDQHHQISLRSLPHFIPHCSASVVSTGGWGINLMTSGKRNCVSPYLFISLSTFLPKFFLTLSLNLSASVFPAAVGQSPLSVNLVPSTAALVPCWGSLSRASGTPLIHEPLNSSACSLCPT